MSISDPDEEPYPYDSWKSILLSTFFWAFSYQLLVYVILPKKSTEYSIRVITMVHGALSAFIGINQCFLIDNPFSHPEWKSNSAQKFIMVTSLGYFIHDLGWCLVYQREHKLMLVHHIYSVFALYRMLFKEYSGAQATCSLGSMELTNPFLQTRWLLRSEGFYPSTLYTAVEITFMFIFFLVRVVLGTYFLVVITFQPKNDWEFRIMGLVIYIMSWMFMYNIFKYFFTKYDILRLSRGSTASETDRQQERSFNVN